MEYPKRKPVKFLSSLGCIHADEPIARANRNRSCKTIWSFYDRHPGTLAAHGQTCDIFPVSVDRELLFEVIENFV